MKGKIFFLAARRLARGQREKKKAGLVSLDGLPGDLRRGRGKFPAEDHGTKMD